MYVGHTYIEEQYNMYICWSHIEEQYIMYVGHT